MADLPGPKMRIGSLTVEPVELQPGAAITLTTREIVGNADRVSVSFPRLPQALHPGDTLFLNDGLIQLETVRIEGQEVLCRVLVGGELRSHKGLNVPGIDLGIGAFTDNDRTCLKFAAEQGVDAISQSFVENAADIAAVREAAAALGYHPMIIAKIERSRALEHVDAILAAADGIMAARGDLGVEIPIERIAVVQKQLTRKAHLRGTPVITATQMLESMIASSRPTRAEATDVANAVYDGTDAVMLSGETAVGKYPVEAVRTMAAVISEVEGSEVFSRLPEPVQLKEHTFSHAIARAAVAAAADLSLKALAVYTETGHSAALVSACRPESAIVAFSRHDRVLRRLALRWGVRPLHGDWVLGVKGVVEQAERELLKHGWVKPGDEIAVTFGMQDMSGPGRTDVLKLWKIRDGG
jgi:pyruvate kinase